MHTDITTESVKASLSLQKARVEYLTQITNGLTVTLITSALLNVCLAVVLVLK